MIHGVDTSFLVAVEVACHPHHSGARALAKALRGKGDRFAIAPQVVAEFVHVVSDGNRFTKPLPVHEAIGRAELWWNGPETERVSVSEPGVLVEFFQMMREHQLGRKRVLDTLLAATFRNAKVASILTLNEQDFSVFGVFTFVKIAPPISPP